MNALHIIKAACIEALDTADDDPHWRGLYCSIVNPHSVLEMSAIIDEFVQYATDKGDHALVADILRRTQ